MSVSQALKGSPSFKPPRDVAKVIMDSLPPASTALFSEVGCVWGVRLRN